MAEKMEKEDFSIEESLKKIEAITAVLENPATSLKDSLAAYAEGDTIQSETSKTLIIFCKLSFTLYYVDINGILIILCC